MQKYIEEKFLQEDTGFQPPWPNWKKQPDFSKLITIEPSHFSNGFEKTIERINHGEFSCCYRLVSLDLSSLCNLKKIKCSTFRDTWSLREIKFPVNLEQIKSGSFSDCTSLVRLDLSYLLKISEIHCDLFQNSWAKYPKNWYSLFFEMHKSCQIGFI